MAHFRQDEYDDQRRKVIARNHIMKQTVELAKQFTEEIDHCVKSLLSLGYSSLEDLDAALTTASDGDLFCNAPLILLHRARIDTVMYELALHNMGAFGGGPMGGDLEYVRGLNQKLSGYYYDWASDEMFSPISMSDAKSILKR